VISEKTRDALARLRHNGRRVSRWAPYGFSLAPEGRLAPEPREQAVLTRIGALREAGLSLRAISEELAASGILARNGRRFAPQTLVRLVTRRAGPRGRKAGACCGRFPTDGDDPIHRPGDQVAAGGLAGHSPAARYPAVTRNMGGSFLDEPPSYGAQAR
jgi:hypothetical protein